MEVLNKFLAVAKPDLTSAEERSVLEVMRSGWLGNGKVAAQLEEEFSHLFGSKGAVAVNSCTMGLMLCLKAEGIGVGDEVIVSPLTFAATVNAILAVGAKPVFCEVDETGCMDSMEAETKITDKTKAIIAVHLHGSPCNMASLKFVSAENGLILIEDAAHAFGGNFLGIPLGTVGDYGVFSFYPTKNLASGDGGIVIGKDKSKLDYIRLLASQGVTSSAWERYGPDSPKEYSVEVAGFKGLMPDIMAAIALSQFHRKEELKEKRLVVWSVYENSFGKKILGHSRHIYDIRVKERERIRKFLHDRGIGTGIHYKALHLEKAYSEFKDTLIRAERIGSQTLSLPLSPTMTKEDAEFVCKNVYEALKGDK